MRHVIAAVALLLACGGVTVPAWAQEATDITIRGRVTPGTCSLSADSVDQTVALDNVNAGDLAAANGPVAGSRKPFRVLAENCAASLSTVSFSFQGATVGTPGHVLVNTGAATGVGIEMRLDDGSDAVIAPNTGQYDVAIDSRRAELRATATYYRLPGEPIRGGSVQARATVVATFR